MNKIEAIKKVKLDGQLNEVPIHFRKDKDVVLAAVKKDGYALQHADEKLKKDKQIVLEAVKKAGYAITYADRNFRKDKEIILSIIKDTLFCSA